MADIREQILARLAVVCAAVDGVAASERNRSDATGLARPAVIIHDGDETRAESDRTPSRGARFSAIQEMVMSPEIEIFAFAEATASGSLLGLYRNRLVTAITADATLRSLVGPNGNINYERFSPDRPAAEGRERRADLGITFTYPFRMADLTEA